MKSTEKCTCLKQWCGAVFCVVLPCFVRIVRRCYQTHVCMQTAGLPPAEWSVDKSIVIIKWTYVVRLVLLLNILLSSNIILSLCRLLPSKHLVSSDRLNVPSNGFLSFDFCHHVDFKFVSSNIIMPSTTLLWSEFSHQTDFCHQTDSAIKQTPVIKRKFGLNLASRNIRVQKKKCTELRIVLYDGVSITGISSVLERFYNQKAFSKQNTFLTHKDGVSQEWTYVSQELTYEPNLQKPENFLGAS